jgi:hypothetical protein
VNVRKLRRELLAFLLGALLVALGSGQPFAGLVGRFARPGCLRQSLVALVLDALQ